MGYASRGTTCPLCGNYSGVRLDGKLYQHRGDLARLFGPGNEMCRASGETREEAQRMREARDARRVAR